MLGNFIETYSNKFNDLYCHDIIALFENYKKLGLTANGLTGPNATYMPEIKNNEALILDHPETLKKEQEQADYFDLSFYKSLKMIFFSKVNECLNLYKEKYPILKSCTKTQFQGMLIQKYPLYTGGAHLFHAENMSRSTSFHQMVYMLYLSDHTSGETEFPYQGLKVLPKKGTLLLFPAGWTHPHRGNPNYDQPKYIITGWIDYAL